MFEVIQADRDEAADVFAYFNPNVENAGEGVRDGLYDAHTVVQAFARHRCRVVPQTVSELKGR